MSQDGAARTTVIDGAPLPVIPRIDGKPWGGRRLADFGFALPPDEPIGEALLTAAEAVVAAGPHAGATLGALAAANPAALCGARGLAATGGHPVFPLLIKLIDAAANLSIQVHPDDDGARGLGPELLGKTEAWVVLAAAPDAIIYAGLASPDSASSASAFEATVRAGMGGTAAHLTQHPAQAGQTVLLPAGTVHALGAGILVYEVQQPSEITYRLDDWGRVDAAGNPRELHVDLGLAAVKPGFAPDVITPIALPTPDGTRNLLAACRSFAAERISLPAATVIAVEADATPQVITCLDGTGAVDSGGERVEIAAGGTVVVPAVAGTAAIQATGPLVVLRSWVPDLVLDVITPARVAGADDWAIALLGGPTDDVRRALGG